MKRLAALLLALACLAGFSGCASLFDKSDYEISDYSAQTEETGDEGFGYISQYSELKRAIVWLVSEHIESAELQFQNYDGSISRDISMACWEVKSSTALGAFAVDYMSSDLSRVVSFYQADIYITYKRSAEQMQALETLSGLRALAARLDGALTNAETYLALELTAASLTPELLLDYVGDAYYANALASPVKPAAELSLYPDSGVERIVEITLDYGLSDEELAARREALAARCAEVLAVLRPAADPDTAESSEEPAGSEAELLQAARDWLDSACIYSELAGSTAWDALVDGAANSEGLAMAAEALCSTLGIECRVVEGRLDNEPHFWNIVRVDGRYCHLDVSGGDVFLAGDEELWGRYWWDTGAYPVCAAADSEASAEADGTPVEASEAAEAVEPDADAQIPPL